MSYRPARTEDCCPEVSMKPHKPQSCAPADRRAREQAMPSSCPKKDTNYQSDMCRASGRNQEGGPTPEFHSSRFAWRLKPSFATTLAVHQTAAPPFDR